MPLDPQAAALIDQARRDGALPVAELTVAQARAAGFDELAQAGTPEAVFSVTDRYIPGPTADLHVRIYRPAPNGPLPAVIYLHGSGWVVGTIDNADTAVRAFANRSGCVFVAVNYQKAPEHPYPAALDDTYATVEWLHANAAALGIDPARIGVAGDSAGGNLAAAVTLRARDQQGPAIAHQLLIYPALDCAFDTPSYRENATGYLLERDDMRWFYRHYLPDPALADDPLVSPLRASDLSRLPRALVITAEFDPLRDDGERYAERLREAGVQARLTRYDGMIHGFAFMSGVLARTQELFAEVGAELRDTFAMPRPRRPAAP